MKKIFAILGICLLLVGCGCTEGRTPKNPAPTGRTAEIRACWVRRSA